MTRTIAALVILTSSSACQRSVGEGPCEGPAACQTEACLEIARESYCTQRCGQCPDGMYCDGLLFAHAGLAVCVRGSQQIKPTMPPHLRCATDSECPEGTVCVGTELARECAAECERDADCPPLTIDGSTYAYLACSEAPGVPIRNACLSREECQANLMICLFSPDAMGEVEFAGLMETLRAAADPQQRSQLVLGQPVASTYFSSAQLLAMMKTFADAGDDPIIPVRSLGQRLVEKEAKDQILALLEHSDHQDEAIRILGLNGQ